MREGFCSFFVALRRRGFLAVPSFRKTILLGGVRGGDDVEEVGSGGVSCATFFCLCEKDFIAAGDG